MLIKRVTRNAGAAVMQVVVSGVLMFFLYRFLLNSIGVERMGIWSVILATTSSVRITELGLTGSVVKFVARYLALDGQKTASDVIQTAAISLGMFIGAVLLAMYFPLLWLLPRILPAQAIPEAGDLLPYALGSLWLTTLSGIFQSGLDGCQRTDLRAIANMLNSILMLVMAVWLVPIYNLMGLAYAQIILAALLLLTTWVFLKSQLSLLPAIPYRWNLPLFREMFRYGLSFQVISVVAILFDPITKVLLSRYGNLSIVGYYEMASRMIGQLRGLMTAAQQVLVPVIAGLQETKPERILEAYREIYRMQVYLSLPFYAGIAATNPAISDLWIGHYESHFVWFSLLLTLGWLLNGFLGPAYFVNLGIGNLRWNMISHVLIGAGNAGLGIVLGMAYGGLGVVIAWVASLALGSFVALLAFHLEHKISLRELFPAESAGLMFACGFGMGGAWFVYHFFHTDFSAPWIALACIALFFASIIIPAWKHSLRPRLLQLIARR